MKKKEAIGKSKRRNSNGAVTADWGGVDAELIRWFIGRVTVLGGAVRFGYSRDGGTYAIGLYDSGDVWTEYCNDPENVEGWIERLGASWE